MTVAPTIIILLTLASWIILSSNNPIIIRLIIISISIILSTIISLNISSWYALILFLIYVGGIIVIFSYFVRLRSNDSIILKTNIHFTALPLILIKANKLQVNAQIYKRSQINIIYESKNTTILLIIIIILLIIIIIVIKIVKKNNAPLRGFNQ